jgi:DNA-binding response OmpR family regulator
MSTTQHFVASATPLAYDFTYLANRLRCESRDNPSGAMGAAYAAASAQLLAVQARLTADLAQLEHEPHRVAALTERLGPLVVGELHIDRNAHVVRMGDKEIGLTPLEYSVLCVLASDPDRVFTRQELYKAVWQGRYSPTFSRSLDSHAYRLRNKLGGRPWVDTVHSVGYRLRPLAAQLAAVR